MNKYFIGFPISPDWENKYHEITRNLKIFYGINISKIVPHITIIPPFELADEAIKRFIAWIDGAHNVMQSQNRFKYKWRISGYIELYHQGQSFGWRIEPYTSPSKEFVHWIYSAAIKHAIQPAKSIEQLFNSSHITLIKELKDPELFSRAVRYIERNYPLQYEVISVGSLHVWKKENNTWIVHRKFDEI